MSEIWNKRDFLKYYYVKSFYTTCATVIINETMLKNCLYILVKWQLYLIAWRQILCFML